MRASQTTIMFKGQSFIVISHKRVGVPILFVDIAAVRLMGRTTRTTSHVAVPVSRFDESGVLTGFSLSYVAKTI